MPTIVPLYAAILALLFVALSANVIRGRYADQTSLGTGGSAALERRIRAHGNFAEYAPLGLLLLLMAEWRGVAAGLLHTLCLALLLGRIAHAAGLLRTPGASVLRAAGMAGTFIAIVGAALTLLVT